MLRHNCASVVLRSDCATHNCSNLSDLAAVVEVDEAEAVQGVQGQGQQR